MSIFSKIASWFTMPRQFTDAQLLEGPAGDIIDHGFHTTEEDYIRVLEYRKRANQLSQRQIRIIDIRIAELQRRIVDREAYILEQEQARARARQRAAEEAVNEIEKKQTPSVRVPQQPSGGSTIKSGERLVDRVADLADSVATHMSHTPTHTPTPVSSVSYSSHKSCSSSHSSYDSHSSSDTSSSSPSGCD
ncbi:hypothetical protein D3C75_494310 [compost metagenome]